MYWLDCKVLFWLTRLHKAPRATPQFKMVRFQHLLAACFVVMLCSSNSMAQDFNPQLPRLLKWLLFWCKKLPKNPELYKSTVWLQLQLIFF